MKHFIYRKADGVPFPGRCDVPDGQGRVPQITDYAVYGVVSIEDSAPDFDPATERVDVTHATRRRAASGAEQTTAADASTDGAALAMLREHERLLSSVVWVTLRQMFPADTEAQTKIKFKNAARPQVLDAYAQQPWK